MLPAAHKNLRRPQQLRSIVYLTLLVIGFAVLGIKTLLTS
jgi:hypothetical protein